MKLQKNKIVFVLVLVCVVLFITVYALLTLGKDKETQLRPDRIPMPDLEENQTEYGSKLEAIEAIEEERETNAPQIYPDHMVDDKGYFNPDYMEYEKQRIIDSIYNTGHLAPTMDAIEVPKTTPLPEVNTDSTLIEPTKSNLSLSEEELALPHQLFFASKPQPIDTSFEVQVDGDQTVREGHRLDLRLTSDHTLNGYDIPKNTRVYGFVRIRPNRVLLEISQLGPHPIALKAHDHQDGQEGLYIENHLKGALAQDALDRTIGEVNLPGVPAIGGLKRIFQRDHRSVKVDIPNNYRLILKP